MESLLGNLMLSYKKEWRKHFFDVLGLAEVQKDQYSGFYTTVTNFSIDGLGYNNLQGGALRPWEGTNSYYEDPRLASFMGRVNYTYDDRYILTVNARGDASSKFGSNHKWGFFPAVSVAWVVGKEKFMEKLTFIDNLKVRAGYGWAGNQNGIDSYTSLNLIRPNGVAPVGSSPVVTMDQLKNMNPDLKWEVKQTFNAGIEMALLGNRLLLTANYYNSKTKDMLILEDEMKAVAGNYYPCTDDGSYGHAGMVTTMIEELVGEGKKYDVCVAIGPMIMMKFVCLLTKKLEIPTIVSMNPIMVDGTGMCGACRLQVGDEIKFACVDGPEFDGHLVDFDQAMKRSQMYKSEEGRAMLKLQEGDTHHGGCGHCGGDE